MRLFFLGWEVCERAGRTCGARCDEKKEEKLESCEEKLEGCEEEEWCMMGRDCCSSSTPSSDWLGSWELNSDSMISCSVRRGGR